MLFLSEFVPNKKAGTTTRPRIAILYVVILKVLDRVNNVTLISYVDLF